MDRASIALALGKPPNATAQQMRSARLRLLLLVHPDKRAGLTRYAQWMAWLICEAVSTDGFVRMVNAWGSAAGLPADVKVPAWPCPDAGRASTSSAPPSSTNAHERRTAHLSWARAKLSALQEQQRTSRTEADNRPADSEITDWRAYINEEDAALARMQQNARRPRGAQAAGGAARAAADAAHKFPV